MRPSVWIVGDWRQADFTNVLARLNDLASCGLFDDAKGALEGFHSGTPASEPAAILIVQSRPEQMSRSEVERLHMAAPLARIVEFWGPWCEGARAKALRALGIVHVPWRAWESRLERELALTGTTNSPVALLPRTATETERIEKTYRCNLAGKRFFGRAAICTSSREKYDSLAEMLRQLGFCPSWASASSLSPIEGPEVSVVDGFEQLGVTQQVIEGPENAKLSRTLLLLHFPRHEDVERAAKLGISKVLAQPLLWIDLVQALDESMAKVTCCRASETEHAR